jgi:hypothetical protein
MVFSPNKNERLLNLIAKQYYKLQTCFFNAQGMATSVSLFGKVASFWPRQSGQTLSPVAVAQPSGKRYIKDIAL